MNNTVQQMAQNFGIDSQSRIEMEVKSDQIGAKIGCTDDRDRILQEYAGQ